MGANHICPRNYGLGLTYHRCASFERLQVLVFIASLALLVLWLVGTATIAQGAHYQFQTNSVRHKRILSVLFVDLQMVQDTRIILTRAAMKAAWLACSGRLSGTDIQLTRKPAGLVWLSAPSMAA